MQLPSCRKPNSVRLAVRLSVSLAVRVAISAAVGSLCPLGLALLVGLPVECNEQEQVARQADNARERSVLLSSAGSDVRRPREVRVGKVVERSKVNDAKVQHKLRDLGRRDRLLPGAGDLERSERVVEVCSIQARPQSR